METKEVIVTEEEVKEVKEVKEDKIGTNEWLVNKNNFIGKSNFEDKYYLETLGRHISNFLKNIPITPVSSYDPKYKRIFFSVGDNSKPFNLDLDMAYFDYITLVKRWLVQFFPQYTYVYEKEEEYSEDEILEMRKQAIDNGEKFDINDALLMRKTINTKSKGLIEKITLKADEFTFNLDGQKSIRTSANLDNPLPLRVFLKELRLIRSKNESDVEYKIRDYIFSNSKEVKKLNKNKKEITIQYPGKTMYNFFVVNVPELKPHYKLEKIEDYLYRWDNYIIKFESETLKNDCINIYESF